MVLIDILCTLYFLWREVVAKTRVGNRVLNLYTDCLNGKRVQISYIPTKGIL